MRMPDMRKAMHRTPKALRAQFFGTAVSFREALGVRMPEMPIRIRTDCASIALRPICERRWISITTVVIIGGALSGASTALMLKRKPPEARVLIIDKTAAFDRKVGESTTEVSSCYMTRILGLTQYLGHHQLRKQGYACGFRTGRINRLMTASRSARYQSRLPGFQVDRVKLDSHMLELACRSGCELWRPAKGTGFELNDGNGQTVKAVVDGAERCTTSCWVIDATGRAAMFARKLGYFRPNAEHPINAVWARFSGVKE
jgi:flavin-dependent dehydrogenase